MIAIDQGVQSANSSVFDVPFKVTPFVTTGQILSIFLCLATQNDILIPIRNFVQLGRRSNWDEVIGESGNRSRNLWWIRIALPNIMKFLSGVLVTFISFVIIVQADNIIDLLKDFTALMVISEVDNILFQLASNGYLGDELSAATVRVREAEIETASTSLTQSGLSRLRGKLRNNGILFVRLVFFLLLLGMFGGWTWIYINQSRGVFFIAKFPGCQDQVELALDKFGDGTCYGGPLNTLGCKFEDGDCSDFNEAYPLCKGDGLIDVEKEVGNDSCNPLFANYECDFDGGDCCPYNITRSPIFEDGLCNGGKISTKSCGFDGGDCYALLRDYPDCPLDDIAKIEGSSNYILGNGTCEGAMYKSELCGREFGDCDVGQLGQDIIFRGVASKTGVDFRTMLSGDGSKLMIGMPATDLNENWNQSSVGQIRFFDYDNKGDIWEKSLTDLVGKNEFDRYGFSSAMNHDGRQVAVGSHRYNNGIGKVNVYHFSTLQNGWVQLGQTLNGGKWAGYTIDMTKDGSRVALSAPLSNLNDEIRLVGKIQVFELDSSARTWNQIGQDILVGEERTVIGYVFLELNLSGSRVYFSSGHFDRATIVVKVYEHNRQANEWAQIGEDIPNPYPHKIQRPAINSEGNRIAVASYTHDDSERAGQVQIFDLDMSKGNVTWVQVGTTLTGSNGQEPDGFGFNIEFDSDGSLLAVASLNPNCLGSPTWCPTGSIKLYRYSPNNQPSRVFSEVPFKQRGDSENVMQEAMREFDKNIFGSEISLSNDGSTISVSGYDFVNDYGFVKVYDLDDLFFSECVVPDQELSKIGDGDCFDIEPYYTAECGYDGGDCGEPIKVDGFENCYVRSPILLENGYCSDGFPYNSEECGYDGGDCPEPVEVKGYPGCFVSNPDEIGNGICWDQPPYGSPECGFDGGDCVVK